MKGNGHRLHRPGDKLFCTREEAEQLAHSAYLLARQEDAKARHELALAFEARIADLEGRIAAVETVEENAPALRGVRVQEPNV